MPRVSSLPAGSRVAFRCDGDEQIGAGHVARCVPLAAAFAQLRWKVRFVGAFAGFASWLVARAGVQAQVPDRQAPCGIDVAECDAAVVDSYVIAAAAICDLARTVPVVTLAEANRCPTAGIVLDYHLDRTEPAGARLLAGPAYAPLDPAFAGAGRAGDDVRRVLVTVGGSAPARELLAQVVPIVRTVFADAAIVVAHEADTLGPGVVTLPCPTALVDAVSDIDLVVTAAGLTAYEMACAGIPQTAIAIVPNQRRVARGLQANGLAPCLDLTSGDSLADLRGVLERLREPGLRRRLAERGKRTFDGQGARRSAAGLARLFAEDSTSGPLQRRKLG